MPLPLNIPNVFSILEVVLNLRDSAHVFNRNVGGGLEFRAGDIPITAPDKQLPYAFVVPIDTMGKTINYAECYQAREAILGIVVCVEGQKHKAQGDGQNPVQVVHSFSSVFDEIENVLLTWRPTGFVMDTNPVFHRIHPLGATENRAWQMMEYSFPYRYYHDGFSGKGVNGLNPSGQDIRADLLKSLFIRYKGRGEFPTVVGDSYFDHVPLPIVPPTTNQKTAFEAGSNAFSIDDAVMDAIEASRLEEFPGLPKTQSAPFPAQ